MIFLPLDSGAFDKVEIHLANRPKFVERLGSSGKNSAVEIKKIYREVILLRSMPTTADNQNTIEFLLDVPVKLTVEWAIVR